jgi:peptidoglycan/LPS O-acetylase OafA/YrhL
VIAILYGIAAAAIALLPRRLAAWVATIVAVPTIVLTVAVFASSASNQSAAADGLILLLATLAQGGAALAMHREASRQKPPAAE